MYQNHINELQQAYKEKRITLYLGAGVSVANGLPSWEQLVLAMYFSIIGEQKMEGWRPFPNYLFAISKWYLSKLNEPLDITMRKLQKYFSNSEDGNAKFLHTLYQTLYCGLLTENNNVPEDLDGNSLRSSNETLDAIARLCERSSQHSGIRDIITYNYDDFVEIALKDLPHQSIFRDVNIESGKLPIYHVHGYMPIRKTLSPSEADELVFTEYQYNKVASNPEHWSNKIQLQSMGNSIGVMVGLSLADRNMRRLLYALRDQSINTRNYILLQRTKIDITGEDLDEIHEESIVYYENFRKSGGTQDFSSKVIRGNVTDARVKMAKKKSSQPVRPMSKSGEPMSKCADIFESEPRYRYEIRGIIKQIEKLDWQQQEFVMEELGITPIWYDSHSEIPTILSQIMD